MAQRENLQSEIHWQALAKTDSSSVIRVGFWTVCGMMAIFMGWATLFPLSSAVITPGTFVSDGKNKQIQHQKGGRIREIFVEEGQRVVVGQPIVELDRVQVQAELTQLAARHASLSALKSRLEAERSGGLRSMDGDDDTSVNTGLRGSGSFGGFKSSSPSGVTLRGISGTPVIIGEKPVSAPVPPDNADVVLVAQSNDVDPVSRELIASQVAAYRSGRKVLEQEIEALDQKVNSLENQKEGLIARMRAQKELLSLRKTEYERLKPLARSGYVARNRLDDLRRTVLELEGSITALEYDVEGVDSQIAEVSVEVRRARVDYTNVAFKEYTKIVAELAEISDQLKAARQSVSSSIVRAPVSGVLKSLLTTTVGGVVGAADLIGEIVPEDAPLVVQARVLPGDIDFVQVGQTAEIAVTAFNRRIDDSLEGTVIYKSADASKDEKTGDPYFTVRLEVHESNGKGRNRYQDVQAGMQSEVYIQTGSRTFLTYLAKPMIDSFRRAFREQ